MLVKAVSESFCNFVINVKVLNIGHYFFVIIYFKSISSAKYYFYPFKINSGMKGLKSSSHLGKFVMVIKIIKTLNRKCP